MCPKIKKHHCWRSQLKPNLYFQDTLHLSLVPTNNNPALPTFLTTSLLFSITLAGSWHIPGPWAWRWQSLTRPCCWRGTHTPPGHQGGRCGCWCHGPALSGHWPAVCLSHPCCLVCSTLLGAQDRHQPAMTNIILWRPFDIFPLCQCCGVWSCAVLATLIYYVNVGIGTQHIIPRINDEFEWHHKSDNMLNISPPLLSPDSPGWHQPRPQPRCPLVSWQSREPLQEGKC